MGVRRIYQGGRINVMSLGICKSVVGDEVGKAGINQNYAIMRSSDFVSEMVSFK